MTLTVARSDYQYSYVWTWFRLQSSHENDLAQVSNLMEVKYIPSRRNLIILA